MNKKGDEKIMSVWNFLIWGVIGIAIVGGVYLIYSAEADVRELQAESLKNKVVDCFVVDGEISEGLFDDKFDIFSECNLDEKGFSGLKGFGDAVFFRR